MNSPQKRLSAKKARMKSWQKRRKNVHKLHERTRKKPSADPPEIMPEILRSDEETRGSALTMNSFQKGFPLKMPE